jgi:hypothetical protein
MLAFPPFLEADEEQILVMIAKKYPNGCPAPDDTAAQQHPASEQSADAATPDDMLAA